MRKQLRTSLALMSFACGLATGDVATSAAWALPLRTQTLCPAGMRACTGTFGNTCYSPTGNMVCMGGVVCAAGQQVCGGPYGTSCYSRAAGQQCLQGIVCGLGESVCNVGGIPQCYNPARGAKCQ